MEFPAWDPVLIDIPGLPIDIRWYGLMYIVGFVAGQWILVRLARARLLPVPADKAPDLVLYCVLGVMLGGRLGYALFYQQDLLHPLRILQVWEGGLAFHGGLLGVVVAAILFARRHRVPWQRIGDALALAVTPGILAVRCANFINGELYGRITEQGVGWAMRFPTDPVAAHLLHLSDHWTMRDRELCIQVAFGRRTWDSVQGLLSAADKTGRPIDWERVRPHLDWQAIADQVPYRHPSQLYEGLVEGLLLGLVLFLVYRITRHRPLRNGHYGALFLLGYAAGRFALEFVRQPDSQFITAQNPTGTVLLGMTMGQTLSVGLVVLGLALLLFSRQRLVPEAVPGGTAGAAP